jgi:hypothetical protein
MNNFFDNFRTKSTLPTDNPINYPINALKYIGDFTVTRHNKNEGVRDVNGNSTGSRGPYVSVKENSINNTKEKYYIKYDGNELPMPMGKYERINPYYGDPYYGENTCNVNFEKGILMFDFDRNQIFLKQHDDGVKGNPLNYDVVNDFYSDKTSIGGKHKIKSIKSIKTKKSKKNKKIKKKQKNTKKQKTTKNNKKQQINK